MKLSPLFPSQSVIIRAKYCRVKLREKSEREVRERGRKEVMMMRWQKREMSEHICM